MRPFEVVARIAAEPRFSDQLEAEAAYRAWIEIVAVLKPTSAALPMSPLELEQAQRVLRCLSDALTASKAQTPRHVAIVREG
jgi:hypothetical protein